MTDNDIVLGLKCLADEDEILCKDCAFRDMDRGFACKKNVSKAAIDLINRQKAKIARLKKELIEQQLKNNLLYETAKETRTEAIKEFAELLKEIDDYVSPLDIDNLVKEMTEETQ
jgi:hypothetical protein